MKRYLYIALFFTIKIYCQNTNNGKFADFKFNNDTLVLVNPINTNLINVSKITPIYEFYYKHHIYNKAHGETATPKHWGVPIKIYLSNEIPKEVRKDFIKFVSLIPKHDNISINFTKNIDQANYYFKNTNEKINKNDSLPEITYNLITDYTYKNTGGIIKINCSKIKDLSEQKRLLRQYFFLSLIQACQSEKKRKENTLLSKHYELSDEISQYDKILFITHYNYYNKLPLNEESFNKVQKVIRKLDREYNIPFKINLQDE